MTEKDKEINELRRKVAELEEENDALMHEIDDQDGPDLFECVREIHRNCVRIDACRLCSLHDTEGCMVQNSPYQWRLPK